MSANSSLQITSPTRGRHGALRHKGYFTVEKLYEHKT